MTTSEQIRQWTGPTLFSYGFRPFFLFGALWAAVAMTLWILMLSGFINLPIRLDAISWHAHEFLFGYLGAIIAGFLLTAIPNWTGRLPVVGWPLAGLFFVWVGGRALMAMSSFVPALLPAAVDLLFPIFLAALILREIVAGKNWRNLIVLALLTVFTVANLIFHIEAARGEFAAQGLGLRLGVGSVVMMISVIAGRIIPSFTRNWMVKQGRLDLPTPPMQRFDKITLAATLFALVSWVSSPASPLTAFALIAIGAAHLARMIRWKGHKVLSEPLLCVLHLGYLFLPLGAFGEGTAILFPETLALGAFQHLWMAGAFALMSLAVMTRATLGHTGQALHAGLGSLVMFVCVIGSVKFRIGASLWPESANSLYAISGALWIAAFMSFVVIYGASLLRPKPDPIHKRA